MITPPLLSVVIPTYHRNDLLAKCLDCLKPGVQTLAADQYEVIVTDDGRVTTAEHLIQEQYPWVKWVAGPQKGPAANRNNGAKVAQGTWVVFTDDDCLPDPQWLEAYAKAIFTKPNCFVLEGRTYVDRPRRSLAETAPLNESGGYLWSCNMAIQNELFEALTGFDERFPYAAMEDVDLRQRLIDKNYTFAFVKTASVCHPWKNKRGWRQHRQHQESTFIYLSIHSNAAIKINSMYYIKWVCITFLKDTLPGVFRYKALGIKEALIEHIAFLRMAFVLFVNHKFG